MFRYSTFLVLGASVFLSGASGGPLTALLHPPLWGVARAAAQVPPSNSITITNESGAAIINYPFQFGRPFLDGAILDEPQVLVGGVPVPTQADVKNRYPDGSVAFAVVAAVIPTIPATGSLTLTFQDQASTANTPLTTTQMLDPAYNFVALVSFKSVAGVTKVASARLMLQNGDYKLWTSGPVAQTIILADDTPSRKYDIGFGDGYHPLRPRFYATFWPATHQVWVRVVVENGLTTELEDMAYAATVRIGAGAAGGNGSPPPTYFADLTGNPQKHWAMSTWTRSSWLGGTPPAQVNIDNNLAYLESTRFVPNYDPAITLSQAQIAQDYTNWWAGALGGTDIGGAGAWAPGMPAGGARGDIGPEPSWDAAWLYTGDWRLRQAALGNADLAAWWPVNLRETDVSERLNRADPVPVAPAVGSGYGQPFSITDRKWLGPSAGGEADLLYYNSDNPAPPNKLGVVGAIAIQPDGANGGDWQFDAAHEPAPFFVPYILTGDPFYLEELEMWAAYDAAANQGAVAQSDSEGRGPTGDEGGAYDQLRGSGWILRSRAEAAFAIPDADPFKTYLTILTQEDIARWEGALGITGTGFDGSAEKVWAQQTGDPLSATNFGTPAPAPALHNWEARLNPGPGQGEWADAAGATSPWMQWYTQYAIGRATELGFAAGPLTLSTGQYLTGMINSTGYPMLIAAYVVPSWLSTGQIASWPQFVANLEQPWLTGVNYTGGQDQGALPTAFANALNNQGYQMYASAALALLVDEGAPGAAQAEAWINANVYQALVANGQLASDPSWAIVPRTDQNALPAQPTATPPG